MFELACNIKTMKMKKTTTRTNDYDVDDECALFLSYFGLDNFHMKLTLLGSP